MKPLENVVSVGSLMRELRVQHTSQFEFLLRVGVKSVWRESRGRGEALYILRKDADMLRRRAKEAHESGCGRGWWSQGGRHATTIDAESQLFQPGDLEQPIGSTPAHNASALAEPDAVVPVAHKPRRRREKQRLTFWGRVKKSVSILFGGHA